MKKLISIILVTVMLAAMIPAASLTATATTSAPSGNWTDEGNYDISWCATLDTADASKTVTVDGKHYYVKGDWTKNSYTIDTAQKLAGVAYLSNLAGSDCFKGDQFFITADIDLGAHKWVPIAMKSSKFRGSLVGKKGNVENAVATISNMSVDTTSESDASSGLIGKFGGDWIKNINLKNATVKAKNFTVGSFVGWQDGNVGSGVIGGVRAGGYVNLSSDAVITLTSCRDDRFDDVGGIIGIINGTNTNDGTPAPIIKGCVFTGTISAPKADCVGGIIGVNQSDGNGIFISDCVVISDRIAWGEDNIQLLKGTEGHNVGCGGIAGNIYSNKTEDVVKYSVTNCYVAANIVNLAANSNAKVTETTNVGGIVGATCSQSKTIENCQFDGIITGKAGSIGTVVGRSTENTQISKVVVSGVGFRSAGDVSAYVGGAASGVTLSSCFGSIEMLTGTGGTSVAPITATTDFSALDLTDVWSKGANDRYPILAVAIPYLSANTDAPSVAKSGAEFDWFTPSQSSFEVDTKAKLDGLALIFDSLGEANSDTIVSKIAISSELTDLGFEGYSAHAKKYICKVLGIDPDAVNDRSKISVQFAQIAVAANVNTEKPDKNGTYNVRVVAKFTDATTANVYFDYSLIQNGNVTKQAESAKITDCYREVIKEINGENTVIKADDGYYVILDIYDVNFKDVANSVISVRAYATDADGTVYYSGSFVNITLTPPAAN